jgi:hypothetical protein
LPAVLQRLFSFAYALGYSISDQSVGGVFQLPRCALLALPLSRAHCPR